MTDLFWVVAADDEAADATDADEEAALFADAAPRCRPRPSPPLLPTLPPPSPAPAVPPPRVEDPTDAAARIVGRDAVLVSTVLLPHPPPPKERWGWE